MESSKSPSKRCITTLNVQVVEEVCTKSAAKSNFSEIPRYRNVEVVQRNSKFTKHSVAPSEYQAAYKRFSYPRSVFSKDPVDKGTETGDKKKGVVVKIVHKIFPKSHKVETNNNPVVVQHEPAPPENRNTGFIDVQLGQHHAAKDMEGLIKNLDELEEISKKKKVSSMRLPNTRVNKVFMLGETDSGLRSTGEPQNFYDLRDEHLQRGTLFEDPEFPANDSSLFFTRRADRHYEWLRPSEIVDNPQLFVEGYSRFDVQQGELGDCWLLAAVANLTLYRRLFFQIVPDDQGFEEKYAGIFHFRFWQYGKWVDVVIDDRLPTYRGQLIYLRSNEDNEFWSALLEKAYAKLNGSYEALKGGSACEAMEDFTGGVTEMYEMNATPPNLFKILLKAFERGSLMSGSLEPDPNVLEAKTSEGLIRGHAYSITQVKYVDIQTPNVSGKIPLLRLRNPWGNEDEWNGAWSDRSPEWQYIPEHEKEELGLTFDYDGEFWMSYKDFQTHFSRLEICNLTPDSLTEEEIAAGHKKKWEMSVFEGDWVRGVTAGGCRNNLDTFWHNPQYRITLTDADEDDEEGKATLIVALMQKHRRSKKFNGVEFLTIGFAVYYLPDPDRVPKPLDLNFFKYHSSVARSPSFINLREVTCRFRLPPGTYCVIPSTFDPNDEGEFLLRVFSEKKNIMEYGSQSNYNNPNPNPSYNPGYNPPGGGGGYGGYNYRPPSSGYFNYSAPPPPSGYNYYPSGYQNYQQNYAQPVYRPQQYAAPSYPRPNPGPPAQMYPPPLPPGYSQPTPPYLPQPQNYYNQGQPPGGPYGFKY